MQEQTADDLWGCIIADYYGGRRGHVAIRRDDDYLETMPPDFMMLYFQPPPENEQQLLAQLRGPVLDVGCGPGRHLLWLQEHGMEAVGIDISPRTVEVARERGCADVRVMSVFDLDFEPGTFNAVIMMFNNMGIGGTEEGTLRLLSALLAVTAPGGKLLAAVRDPLATDRPAHMAYHQANRDAGRPPGQVRIRYEYDGKVEQWFDLLLFEPERATALLQIAGWADIECSEQEQGGMYYVCAVRP